MNLFKTVNNTELFRKIEQRTVEKGTMEESGKWLINIISRTFNLVQSESIRILLLNKVCQKKMNRNSTRLKEDL